jgi:hypothetical protein
VALCLTPLRANCSASAQNTMIGARAPRTIPTASETATYMSCFYGVLPDSRSGTTTMSTTPVTGEVMPLV